MTREEYISELRARISHLPTEEREAAMRYYIEYLQDASDKTMEQIIEELGTPRQVAERIIAECFGTGQGSRRNDTGCLVSALALVTSPVWIPLLFAAAVTGAVLLFVAVLLVLVFGVVSIALVGAGIWSMTVYPATGIAALGGALICAGLTVLCIVGFMTLKSGIQWVVRTLRSRS